MRVGVGDGGDDARYARLYQCFGAGRGAAVVAAWFEGNVGGGAARVFARLAQGVDFGMGAARFEVEALADDLAVVCDDAADARIGRGGEAAFGGEGQGAAHHVAVGVVENGGGGCGGG
ncbi:hypothetical protein NEIELOOT_01996 [Neisseria elongata subsp. glycolytica ATCC 29315]|uniref:Uncharacterized protein n=1 Tax=Neisseria elongata subsp. glycolytica ATCC 29315 TaxID=546263 RepID=D4DSF1_NEIEG|nr:hypothetical protein NEIELOOT_01996 [Neisseria elongata subsp. glycolytica ATCC 29315]